MKKFKKNISKTIFASFFILQFVASTAFVPDMANAEEIKEQAENIVSEQIKEETVREEVKEEPAFELAFDEQEGSSSESSDSVREAPTFELANDSLPPPPQGQIIDGHLDVCKVTLNEDGEIVPASNFPGATFTIPVTFQGADYTVVINSSDSATTYGNARFSAICESQKISINTALESYAGLEAYTYGEEITSDGYVWDVTYFEGDAQGETGLFNAYGGLMSGEFGPDELSDGTLLLNGNPFVGHTGENKTTLFVVNKFVDYVKPADTTKIYATKIVCNAENLLPNWGDKPSRVEDIIITSNTASEFLADKGDNCWIDQDWDFQYKLAYDPIADEYTNVSPGDNLGEVAGWTTFNGIEGATIVADGNSVWVREVMEPGYLDFSGSLIDNEGDAHSNVSAEMYCHNDVWNYDNFDLVAYPYSEEGPYHCISFNVLLDDEPEEPNFCPAGTTLRLLETIEVLPNAEIFYSSEYASGNYLLEASGTYIYRNYKGQGNEFYSADALYENLAPTDPGYGTNGNGYYTADGETWKISGASMGIRVNNQNPRQAWGTTFNPAHEYFYEVEDFPGGMFNFQITDSYYEDNEEFLTVKISDCVDSTDPEQPNFCPAFARIVIEEFSNERNGVLTNGNMSDDIFLGTNDVSEVTNSGEWFTIDDFDTNLYEEMPGMAVQRLDGRVRLGIHGSLTAQDREYVRGYIEILNGEFTGWISDESGNNRLETLENTPNGTLDTVILTNSTRVDFILQVNTNDDFFFIDYDLQEGDCGGTGGGDDINTVNTPNACVVRGTDDYNFLSGVTATNSLTGEITLVIGGNVEIVGDVDFNTIDEYPISYTFTFGTDTIEKDRIIEIKTRCSGGGSSGGGSSGGSSGGRVAGASDEGEVLGATSCLAFTTYNRLGSAGAEVKALQTFLNMYMNAGLTVDGVYGRTTTQAVHDFQAFHWNEVIDPWTPPLSPNTTGWQYKTTRMTINAIIDCPEAPVYLEDPGITYQVLEVEGEKTLTQEQIETIYNLLAVAQAEQILGATSVNYNAINVGK